MTRLATRLSGPIRRMLAGLALLAACAQAEAAGGASPLDTLVLDDLKATRDLPLFTPARHPPPPPPPPPPPEPPQVAEKPPRKPPAPPKPPRLRLVGVIMTGDTNIALMMGQQRTVQRLAVGDEVDGWKVTSVQPHAVEMKFRKEARVYRMFRSRVRVPAVAAAGEDVD